jgi:hypothetical protein
MTDAQSLKKVRVFVGSPTDMKPERECVSRVIARLNDTTARNLGMRLEFSDWSTLIRPAMARPEAVILDQLPVETWDIFIGLLWLRFGTPTGGADPSGAPFAGGTHEEFTLAYGSWEKTGKPNIMFYRCERVPEAIDDIDPTQFQLIKQFFKAFSHDKRHPGIYQTFRETEELGTKVDQHLSDLLFKHAGPWDTPRIEIARKGHGLKSGQAYEVVAVSLDIAKHSEIVRQDKGEADRLLKWFAECVNRIFAQPHWAKISWTPDGGMFVASGETRYDRAALAGIRLLMEVTMHNLESGRLPLAIRVAASDGQLVWNDDTSQISSETLNFTKHLEDDGTEAGEFSITDTVHLSLNGSLKAAFSQPRRYRNRRVLAYKSASPTAPPTDDSLSKLVSQTTQLLRELIARHSTPVLNEGTQRATSDIDVIYCQLETFIHHVPIIDDRWAEAYVRQVNDWTTSLLDAERDYWNVVCANYMQAAEGSPEHEHWASVSAIVGRRRTVVVLPLARVKGQTEVRINRMPKAAAQPAPGIVPAEKSIDTITSVLVSPALDRKVREFIDADPLQEEELFAELMSAQREALIAGVASPDAFGDLRETLLKRLWTLTDLILIDELQDLRAGLFATLARNPATRLRYGALTRILRSTGAPTQESIEAMFAKAGLPFTVQDLHVVWRSIVVGIPKQAQRVAALAQIPVEILWRTIASANIRVSALCAVAERFKGESEDMNKIFFDCVHARLMREVQAGGKELPSVGKLISHFFQNPLFVQSPYFERLDDLLLSHKRASNDMNLAADIFDKLAVKLRQIREDRGNPQASIPAGIGALPLPVQRHLASSGRYINSFVLHPDYRIAAETLPFITMGNVESLIAYRQINEKLFQKILYRKEFFVTQTTALVALQHPKCPVEFGRGYLPKIGEANLKKVIANLSAHPAVREMARRLISARQRVTVRP